MGQEAFSHIVDSLTGTQTKPMTLPEHGPSIIICDESGVWQR
jgi:hypothetical protein